MTGGFRRRNPQESHLVPSEVAHPTTSDPLPPGREPSCPAGRQRARRTEPSPPGGTLPNFTEGLKHPQVGVRPLRLHRPPPPSRSCPGPSSGGGGRAQGPGPGRPRGGGTRPSSPPLTQHSTRGPRSGSPPRRRRPSPPRRCPGSPPPPPRRWAPSSYRTAPAPGSTPQRARRCWRNRRQPGPPARPAAPAPPAPATWRSPAGGGTERRASRKRGGGLPARTTPLPGHGAASHRSTQPQCHVRPELRWPLRDH